MLKTMRSEYYARFLAAAAALALSACTMAPRYSRPAAPVPAAWPAGTAAVDSNAVQAGSTNASQLPWSQFIRDEKLRKLVDLSLQNNRDLRLAVLNVERARALYHIQRNELFPSVSAAATGGERRVPGSLSSSHKAQTVEQYSVDLGVYSWELDFFGRIRSMKDRALQEYLATGHAARAAQILLVSSVADAWLSLAADRQNLKISQTTLEAQQGSFDLVKRRFDLGLTPELDVFRARTQVEQARADSARFRQRVAQGENALRLLAGTDVPGELLPESLSEEAPTVPVVEGLPSDVLLQRPDVLRAEALLKAAYADIGAARAAFFPRISLTATLGTASSDLTGLFKAGSGTWSYAPQIVMPIFDTRTWSALRTSKVQQQIAVTEYERAIQSAFREVADTLAVRATVDEQLAAQKALVEAVSQTYKLSQLRYEQGIDDYLSVLDAQRSLYAAQQGLVALQYARSANEVRTYSVLGGGGQ